MPPPSCRDVDGREDAVHRLGVARGAGEGAVEIHDVQPGEALAGEDRRLPRRVVPEDRGPVHVPLDEADATASLQVDRGIQDHRPSF